MNRGIRYWFASWLAWAALKLVRAKEVHVYRIYRGGRIFVDCYDFERIVMWDGKIVEE